jgi:hypothetical protein
MQASAIRRRGRIVQRAAALAAFALALAACSADMGLNNVTFTPPSEQSRSKPDWATFSGAKTEFTLRPVTQADLVGPEGQCAPAPGQQASAAPGEPVLPPSVPTVQGGIALQMTECDVVRRAGAADKVDIGANERGERAVTITFTRGPWPGIYRFDSGRLTSVERVNAPAPAPKGQKSLPAQKKPTGT